MASKLLAFVFVWALVNSYAVGAFAQAYQAENLPGLLSQSIQLKDLPYLENSYRYTLEYGEFLLGVDLYHRPGTSQFEPENVGFQLVIPFEGDADEKSSSRRSEARHVDRIRLTPKVFFMNEPVKIKMEGLVYNEYDKLVASLSFDGKTGEKVSIPVRLAAGGLLKTQIELQTVDIVAQGFADGVVQGKGSCSIRQKTFLAASQPQWRKVGCEVSLYYNTKEAKWDGSFKLNEPEGSVIPTCESSSQRTAERVNELLQQYRKEGESMPDSLLIPETWQVRLQWDKEETVTKTFVEAILRPDGLFENQTLTLLESPPLAVNFDEKTFIWVCHEMNVVASVKSRTVLHFLTKKGSLFSDEERMKVKGVDLSFQWIQSGVKKISFLKKVFGKIGTAINEDVIAPLENTAQRALNHFVGANVETVVLETKMDNGKQIMNMKYKVGGKILNWNLLTGTVETEGKK